jgi:hypothetical protein
MKRKSKLSSKNLKQTLWETLNLIKSKGVTPTEANAIATQSREIIRIVRTELVVLALNGDKPKSGLLGNESRRQS